MEAASRICDGLLNPKNLQESSIDFIASLLLEVIEFLTTSLRWQASQQHREREGKSRDQSHESRTIRQIDYLLRNLKAYIGIEPILGSEATLPAHFCDQILANLASKKKLTDTVVRCLSHKSMGCVTKLPYCDIAFITRDTFKILVQQPLVDLSLHLQFHAAGHNEASSDLMTLEDLVAIIDSPASTSLRSLFLSGFLLSRNNMKFMVWLRCLKSLTRLQLESVHVALPVDFGASIAKEIDQLPSLTVFIFRGSTLQALPCKTTTLRQLSLPDVPVRTNAKMLTSIMSLRNLISLDLSRHKVTSSPTVPNSEWIMNLSELPHLRYLDLSCNPVSIDEMAYFDPPHHRMSFLGLLSTQACMRKDINCNLVSKIACTL